MSATSEANARRLVSIMQVSNSTETERDGANIIRFVSRTTLLGRLTRELRDLASEMAVGIGVYLKIAFFPDRIKDWLPLSLARKVWYGLRRLVTHPIAVFRDAFAPDTAAAGYIYEPVAHSLEFMADTPSPDEKKRSRRSYFRKVLAVSGVIHMIVLVYLGVMAMFGQFLGLKIVNKPYRKLASRVVVDKLYYSPEMLSSNANETTPLEQLLEEERRRRERERIEREKAERERLEKEAKEKEGEANKTEEEPKEEPPVDPPKFGEINEAPIKDLIGKVYKLYQTGQLDVNEAGFTVMASFKVNCDGTISNIKVVETSGNAVIDDTARQVLHLIGESRAVGALCKLTSNTISLDLNDKHVRLHITSFAETPRIASEQASFLNNVAFLAKLAQKGDTAELLSQLKVTPNNKRIDADLTLTRARATEMMQARFGGSNPQD